MGELAALPSSIIDNPLTLWRGSTPGDREGDNSSKLGVGWTIALALEGGVARLALLISAFLPILTEDLFDLCFKLTVPLLGSGGGTS